MVALIIAVVGVAGVLAFSVSVRTREFAIRLAIGSQPRHLLTGVIAEGTVITALGIGAGFAGGLALKRLAGSYFEKLQTPRAWVVVGAAGLLMAAAVVASAWPAMRAARGRDSSFARGLAPPRPDGFQAGLPESCRA